MSHSCKSCLRQISVDAMVHAPEQQQSHQKGAAAPAPSAAEAGPKAAQAELTWLRRRYGSGFRLHPPSSGQQQQQQGAETSVTLTPTDPAWDRGGLCLRFRLDGSYPAAGSITVTSAASCPEPGADSGAAADGGGASGGAGASGSMSGGAAGAEGETGPPTADAGHDALSAGAAAVLAKLLTAQATDDARRPTPLKALVRSLENAAAQHVQQVAVFHVQLLKVRPVVEMRPELLVNPPEFRS